MVTSAKSSLYATLSLVIALHGPVRAEGNGPTSPLPSDDKSTMEELLGKGVIGEAIPAPEVTDTDQYLVPQLSARNFRIVSGPDTGRTVRYQPTQIRHGGGETTWKYDAGGKLAYFLTAKPNGDYVVIGVEDREVGALTRCSPSQPFMLQGLKPGAERKRRLDIKVFDLSSPEDLIYQGTMDVSYRYIGAYQVKVPAGSFDAVLMKWTFKGEVGPASIDVTQYRFFAPNVGIVAEVEQQDVSAMLVYNRHTEVARVLSGTPR